MNRILLCLLFLALLVQSCRKDSFITGKDARVRTSEEALRFDTVFTTTGSVTQFFRIYNDNKQKLKLSSVKLAGGSASYFKINVDGFTGPEVSNLEMEAEDSLYVFVTVKINPTAADLPFVVQDSIQISYNGTAQWVKLEAWGQNARFYRSRVITANESWDNQKPYVILGGLQVAPNVTLTINKGTRVYLHADAPFVVDGTLLVRGEKYDSTRVVFQGDRLDEPYRDYPAAWPGIYFRQTSRNSDLQYAIIKNAYQGIVVDQPSVNANPKLNLRESIIDNCYDAGILTLRTAVNAQNCLISNCGKNIILAYGGTYNFTHVTSAAYSNNFILHKEPALLVTDFVKDGNTILTAPLTATFTNCIFWGENGTVDNEAITSKQGTNAFTVNFRNCLWKAKTDPANSVITNSITNITPEFDSINNQKRYYDFRLKDISPALNKGLNAGVLLDLDGKPRPVGVADIGCYERQ